MSNERPVFTKIFHDNIEILSSRLGEAKAAEIVYKYIIFNATGDEPDFSDDPAAGIAFDFLRRNNDASTAKNDDISQKRSEAGSKGGRPKASETNEKQKKANESNVKQAESKKSRKEKKRKEEEKKGKENEVLVLSDQLTLTDSDAPDDVDTTTYDSPDDFQKCFEFMVNNAFKDEENEFGALDRSTTKKIRRLLNDYGGGKTMMAFAVANENSTLTIQAVESYLRDPPDSCGEVLAQ